jgi:hypothetical protein
MWLTSRLSRLKVMALSVLCLLASCGGALQAGPGDDLSRALNAYEASLGSLWSFDVFLLVNDRRFLTRDIGQKKDPFQARKTNAPAIAPVYKQSNAVYEMMDRQRLSGQNFRFDCLKGRDSVKQEGDIVTAWNGERLCNYNSTVKAGRVRGSATVRELIGENSPPYPLLFKMAFGNCSYSNFIRDRDSYIETIGDLLKITAPPAPSKSVDANIYGATLWISPRHGYMPARIEWYVSKSGRLRNH